MTSKVRLAEVIGALSIATDLAMAQPLEAALASCILSVRLAEAAGLDEATVADCYWHALLRFIGCNADTYVIASLLGDEMAVRSDFATIDPGRQREVCAMVVKAVRRSHAGDSPLQVAVAVVRGAGRWSRHPEELPRPLRGGAAHRGTPRVRSGRSRRARAAVCPLGR